LLTHVQPNVLYTVVLWVSIFVAVLFIALIFFTSKGDAMSSGGSVRTSYKGRTTTEDKIAKMTLSFAAGFVGLMLLLDFLSPRTAEEVSTGSGPARTPAPAPAQSNSGSEIPDSAKPAPNNTATPAPKLEEVEAPPFATGPDGKPVAPSGTP